VVSGSESCLPRSGLENRLGEEIPLAAFDNDPRLLSAEEFDASHGPGWLQGLIDSIKHETVSQSTGKVANFRPLSKI
jgi:hypothetical protein